MTADRYLISQICLRSGLLDATDILRGSNDEGTLRCESRVYLFAQKAQRVNPKAPVLSVQFAWAELISTCVSTEGNVCQASCCCLTSKQCRAFHGYLIRCCELQPFVFCRKKAFSFWESYSIIAEGDLVDFHLRLSPTVTALVAAAKQIFPSMFLSALTRGLAVWSNQQFSLKCIFLSRSLSDSFLYSPACYPD